MSQKMYVPKWLLILDGTAHNTHAYSAYGINMTDDAVQTFGFNGEVADAETGLIYLRNRYYDPQTGTFLTQDPVKDGLNWYAYCAGDPVNYTDPWGLWEPGDENYPQFIQKAIKKYTVDWNLAYSFGDENGMITAHGKAESARELGDSIVYRSEWGAQNFVDWEFDINKTDIVIHHTDNNDSIQKIEKEHIDNGWSGIGYHYVIAQDGTVYEGRPIDVKGSHVDMANTGKIGIVLIGDYHPGIFNHNTPTQPQLESMVRLVDALKISYSINIVKGHRDYNDVMPNTETVCPGDTLYDMMKRIY